MFEKIIKFLGWGKAPSNYQTPSFDDAPEWTDETFKRAEVSENGKVSRPATGTLTNRTTKPLPPKGRVAKTPRTPKPLPKRPMPRKMPTGPDTDGV